MGENLKTISKLLDDFSNFIDNRQTVFWFCSEEMSISILNWHFRMWHGEQSNLSHNQDYSVANQYFISKRILNSIMVKIEETTLKQKEDFLFFRCFKKHIEMHKEDYIEVKGKKSYYAEDSLRTFYRIIFETDMDYPMRLYLWEDWFPPNWKVTKNNLETNRLTKISRDQFLEWAKERICNPKEEYDKKLDIVVENLFPEVDPAVWSIILIFVFSPYRENRVRSIIEQPWNFGRVSRTRSFTGVLVTDITEMIQKQEKKESQNTFELSFQLFREHFNRERIQEHLDELRRLTYQKDSKEEQKRLLLLDVFTGMLKFLNQ